MNFPQAIASCFRNYATFSGRASRSEYWYFALFMFLGGIVASILDAAIGGSSVQASDELQPISTIFNLLIIIPSLAVDVRRMHDLGRSGWWLLLYFTIIGIIVPLLIWKCQKGTEGPNKFGADPLAPAPLPATETPV